MLNILIAAANGRVSQQAAADAMYDIERTDFASRCKDEYIVSNAEQILRLIDLKVFRAEVIEEIGNVRGLDTGFLESARAALAEAKTNIGLLHVAFGITLEMLEMAMDNDVLAAHLLERDADGKNASLDIFYTAEAVEMINGGLAKLAPTVDEKPSTNAGNNAQSELVIEPVDGEGAGATKKPTPATESKKKSQK